MLEILYKILQRSSLFFPFLLFPYSLCSFLLKLDFHVCVEYLLAIKYPYCSSNEPIFKYIYPSSKIELYHIKFTQKTFFTNISKQFLH